MLTPATRILYGQAHLPQVVSMPHKSLTKAVLTIRAAIIPVLARVLVPLRCAVFLDIESKSRIPGALGKSKQLARYNSNAGQLNQFVTVK